MLGAVIGDIVGSRFEWNNIKTKDFEFLTYRCFVTDDSIMSLAVAKAILDSGKDWDKLNKTIANCLQEVGRPYPDCGYGGMLWGDETPGSDRIGLEKAAIRILKWMLQAKKL